MSFNVCESSQILTSFLRICRERLMVTDIDRNMQVWRDIDGDEILASIKYWEFNANKNPIRCNSMQIFIYCKVAVHVSGVTAPIIRSTKNCNRNLRYRSYCKIQGLTGMN